MTATQPEPESKYVQAGDLRLHYQELGAGYPVICLHGSGPGANGWSAFQANAQALAERYRVLIVDLPQFGRSDKVVIEGGRLTFNARVFRDFLNALGIEHAHFVGSSMGGQIGLKLAIDYPDRVGKLVVIGATPIQSLLSPSPAEGPRLIYTYYQGSGPSLEKMRWFLQTAVYDPAIMTEDLVQERYQASIDPDAMRVQTSPLTIREDLRDQLLRVAAPTLLVWGQDDRFAPIDIALTLLKHLQDARLHVFQRCGHWPQVEHAAEFNRLVREFLG